MIKRAIACLVVIAACTLTSGIAEAKRGIAIINTGEDVVKVADITEELRAKVEGDTQAGAAVGIMYSRFGLFWLDIWRWDKKYVLFADDSVWDITEEQAKELAGGDISKPFTLTVPPGLIVLLAIGVGFIGLMFLGRGGDDEDETGGDAGDQEPAV